MITFFYNLALFLFLLFQLPKALIQWKKYQSSYRQRLGLDLPTLDRNEQGVVIWIHAVSVGETRAALPLIRRLKEAFPHGKIVLSSTTQTGFDEAERTFGSLLDLHFFLPLDFSWIMKRLVASLRPNLLLLMEGELWYHLLSAAKSAGTRTVVVNAKMSEKSMVRYKLFSFFAKPLFSLIDHFCVQNRLYQERLLYLGVPKEKMSITGNIKWDIPIHQLTASEKGYWKAELGIEGDDRIIVLGSTHPNEEMLLLGEMKKLWEQMPRLKVLLVPRHPERFSSVADYLSKEKIAFIRFSARREMQGDEQVILVDVMGFLTTCYQLADAAIVGGTYVSGVGGHNLIEPIQCGTLSFFGSHTEKQKELESVILGAKAGQKLPLSDVASVLKTYFENSRSRQKMLQAGKDLLEQSKGSSEKTWKKLSELLFLQERMGEKKKNKKKG